MILDDAVATFQQILSRPFRMVFEKTMVVTVILLVFLFVAIERLLIHFLVLPSSLLTASVAVLVGIALVIGFAFAITPVSFVVASFFFDEVAQIAETEIDPGIPAGRRPSPNRRSSR